MKIFLLALLAVVTVLGFSAVVAEAKVYHKHHQVAARHLPPPAVVAVIDVGAQRLSLTVEGQAYGYWPVSTARAGYHTPRGTYSAIRLARVYYSKKYDNSPMPNSVFFHGGYAIHGTYHIRGLGHPVSHGCVRLLPQHSAELFSLVEEYGMGRTRIVITD